MRLSGLLDIRPGVTAVIGGGGKTTLLRTLGEELSRDYRVVLCATTKIYPFPGLPLGNTARELEALESPLVCAGRMVEGTDKLTAPEAPMERLMELFDYVLVEADGSAGRPMKAHAPHEPVIPPQAGQTICVVGASGFGRPIREAAHRPERYAALAGVPPDTVITPDIAARVLRAEGLHHQIFGNQAETPVARALLRALAAGLGCPVTGGSLQRGEYFQCLL